MVAAVRWDLFCHADDR